MWMIFLGGIIVNIFQVSLIGQAGNAEPALPELPGVGFYLLAVLFLYISQLPLIIWARVSTLGRRDALDGGVPALLGRGLWCMWRYICMFGWAVLIMIVGGIIVKIASSLGAFASFDGGVESLISGSGLINLIIGATLYAGILYSVSVLMGIYLITVHAESQDAHLHIRESYKTLGPRAWKLGAAILAGQVAMGIASSLASSFFGSMFATMGLGSASWIIGLLLLMFAGALVNFFYLNLAAVYADLLTD